MHAIHHRYADINGQQLFYREEGAADVPAVVLMHGFPEAHLDGTQMRLGPGQSVILHDPDLDLNADEVAPGRQPWLVMTYLGTSAVWADAIFVSGLQRCDESSAGQVRQAVAAVIRTFGCSGCAGRVAQEFGDHPETAVIRMRWARAVAREAFADPAPEPGLDADAHAWLVICPPTPVGQASCSPRAERRQPTRSATDGEG
jgi:pimeloyl-ACP methyl ester carboxylesterase